MDQDYLIGTEFKKWAELTPKQQRELFQAIDQNRNALRAERNYLRSLLLSNSGRTSDEIDNILRQV